MAMLKLPAPDSTASIDPLLFELHGLIRWWLVDSVKAISDSGTAILGMRCVSRATRGTPTHLPDDVKVSRPGTLDEDSKLETAVDYLCNHLEVGRKDC